MSDRILTERVRATALSGMGYRSMICENLLGVGSYTDSPRGKLPDMRCGALEAVAAGFGEIGRSGALLTDEHGPHQRVICIVTDADLPADAPKAATDVCDVCALCADLCPMHALGGETVAIDVGGVRVQYPLVPRHRCDWSKRYSLCPGVRVKIVDSRRREGSGFRCFFSHALAIQQTPLESDHTNFTTCVLANQPEP